MFTKEVNAAGNIQLFNLLEINKAERLSRVKK